MSAFLSPFFGAGAQLFTNSGVPLAGGKIYTYVAGTTTPASTYTDGTGSIVNPNPVILDASGRVPGELWLAGGLQYKIVLTDANGVTVGYTYDNISGVNDASYPQVTVSEWNLGSSPTYVSATTLTVPGNQTTTYQVNRRIQATVTAGTATGTISSSSYSGGVTTIITVWDSTQLDSGLSQLKYSLLSATPTSLPATVLSASSYQGQTVILGTTGGTTSAFILAPSVPIVAYTAGQEFDVTFNATNLVNATMSISGLSQLPLYKANSSGAYIAVAGGEVVAGWRSRVTVLAGAATLLIRDIIAPYAASGANNDITALTALTTPLTAAQGGAQLFPITASVAGSALTVNLANTSLDFRSGTLTTGTATRIASGALSITVPSTATLGSVSGTSLRVGVAVAYNGGTPALCVVNGTVDESALYSPTTISTGANTIGTVYSASTVSANSPMRLLGYVDVPNVTAGTYASITQVQSYGGTLSPASLGVGQTWQTVTRTSGTTYYNTTGKPITMLSVQSVSSFASLSVSGIAVWGASFGDNTGQSSPSASAIIPAGAAYVYTQLQGTTKSLVELR